MGEFTREFTEANFETEVLQSDKPVIVDFWAEWCGPCRMIAPSIDAIAEAYKDSAVVGKVNVDHHPAIATQFGIRSIPSLLFISDGKVQEQVMGAIPKEQIEDNLKKLL
jgi:thioredoxin 1